MKDAAPTANAVAAMRKVVVEDNSGDAIVGGRFFANHQRTYARAVEAITRKSLSEIN
jgi:hypothetical protein